MVTPSILKMMLMTEAPTRRMKTSEWTYDDLWIFSGSNTWDDQVARFLKRLLLIVR